MQRRRSPAALTCDFSDLPSFIETRYAVDIALHYTISELQGFLGSFDQVIRSGSAQEYDYLIWLFGELIGKDWDAAEEYLSGCVSAPRLTLISSPPSCPL